MVQTTAIKSGQDKVSINKRLHHSWSYVPCGREQKNRGYVTYTEPSTSVY